MLFQVRTAFREPRMPAEQLQALFAREQQAARRLQDEGVIVQLWRVPGTRITIGIWSARDEDELDRLVAELPCAPYMDREVTPVVAHPNSVRGVHIDPAAGEAADDAL